MRSREEDVGACKAPLQLNAVPLLFRRAIVVDHALFEENDLWRALFDENDLGHGLFEEIDLGHALLTRTTLGTRCLNRTTGRLQSAPTMNLMSRGSLTSRIEHLLLFVLLLR